MNYRLKSEIKMNKLNLLQIIQKDLEEIKILSEEASEATKNPTLIIELALSKSRLLSQEIELLRDFILQEIVPEEEPEEEKTDQEIDDSSEVAVADPELEIINFEMEEDEDTEELVEETQEKEPELEEEEVQEDEAMVEEPEEEVEEEDEPIEEDEELVAEEDELELQDDREEEETEEDEDEVEESDEEDEEEVEFEEPAVKSKVQITELKSDPQPGIREIHIDDLEDDDSFAPVTEPLSRPVMREIPKPEEPAPEKMVIGEKFQKERSLNDAMGETKVSESKLTNGPIASLRAAIGLNDRFLFIREIFDNNADRYNLIIDQLDKLETIQQAVDYLKSNLTLQKNETSMKFVELLKRRFTK